MRLLELKTNKLEEEAKKAAEDLKSEDKGNLEQLDFDSGADNLGNPTEDGDDLQFHFDWL